ncbi:MAG TPA: DUF4258 domain-containing protein [Bryobacterales bacterium]|nr:DUF4258 domain-containing protein [Bryobacterales bacterium]
MSRRRPPPQPWKPADATDFIRAIARDENLHLATTRHCRQRLGERNLITGDLLHVPRRGHVYEDPQPSTNPEFCKYGMESTTPNSHGRCLRVVVIPDPASRCLKAVTVMWIDEG